MVSKMLESNVEKHRDIRQRSSHLHKIACPLSSSKFKCDVATRKVIPYDEFTALKGAEADKTNQQQENKIIMPRRQHEETSNMDAKIREESKLKRQRQEAREAARMAIIKMEQSVNVDDNFQVMRDFEALIGIS